MTDLRNGAILLIGITNIALLGYGLTCLRKRQKRQELLDKTRLALAICGTAVG